MLKASLAPIALLALMISGTVTGPPTPQAAARSKRHEHLVSFKMTCTPQIIGPNDRVQLTIPMPHGGELGIETPTGALEYVAFYMDSSTPSEYLSTISGPEFKYRHKVELDIKTLSTFVELTKTSKYRRIFTVNGRYKVYIAKDFEDYMLPWTPWCDLDYRNPAEPHPPPPQIYFSD
jgi:hypothetical protein